MDNSREVTIARFHLEMQNHALPWTTRARAARQYYRIKKQVKDRVLARLRYQYLRADAAGDIRARETIGDKVTQHMFKKYKRRI